MNKILKKIDFIPYTSRVCIYTATTNSINYWKNFDSLRVKYSTFISKLQQLAYTADVDYIWLFFEPHLEITFIDKHEKYSSIFIEEIEKLAKETIEDVDFIIKYQPSLDCYGDWVGKSTDEKLFGCVIHTYAFKMLNAFNEYNDCITQGLGSKIQASRTIHRIFNPLGLNYKDEGKICFWRSMFCFMRWIGFNHNTSVWIYKKIFRQTYYN